MILRTILSLVIWSSFPVKAQDTLRYRLQEVAVSAVRFQFSGNELRTDTTAANLITAGTAGELLSREPGVFIRNYGPGNISTISLRGLGAVHTPVFWHGLPVNSPMLGLSDLSILPSFLTGGMSIQHGGLAPLSGSGAISGSVYLGDPERDAKGCHIDLLTASGSFGERQTGIELGMYQPGFSNRTRLYSSGSTNDFPYTSPDGRRLNQSHAAMNQMGFTHDFVLQAKNARLESHLWYLESERDLPPHMLGGSGSQEQSDGSLRWITSWSREGMRSHTRISVGMSRERLRFSDSSVRLDDRSRSLNSVAGLESGYRLNPFLKLEGQLAIQHATAQSDGYTGMASQQQWNLTGKAVVEKKHLDVVCAFRSGFAGGISIPLLPSLNTRWRLNRVLPIQGEGSRVYRIPTLNDQFWRTGGNPGLKPEKGWSASAGFQLQDSFRRISWSIRNSLFLIRLSDAITWLPDDQAVYRAVNMHTLLSKGLESTMNVTWTTPGLKISAAWSPTLVSSVIRKTGSSFDHLAGMQLPYTPRLCHKGFIDIQHRGFGLRYLFQYYGHRYTTQDQGYFLAPYIVSDLFISWRNNGKRSPLTLTFAIKNLYDVNYQVMAWRAMPGRSFHLGLLLSLAEAAN